MGVQHHDRQDQAGGCEAVGGRLIAIADRRQAPKRSRPRCRPSTGGARRRSVQQFKREGRRGSDPPRGRLGRAVRRHAILFYRSPGDWWLNSKYKFSAHSTDGGIIRPLRLWSAGWSLGWSANNVVYDWEPDTTISKGSCTTVTTSVTPAVGSIGISGQVCPEKVSPWRITSRESGSIWMGQSSGTDYYAAFGVQANHNPPNASSSYDSTYYIEFS